MANRLAPITAPEPRGFDSNRLDWGNSIVSTSTHRHRITMTAQVLRSHLSQPHQSRYTLVFRNGELLRHQDPLSLAQYRADARVLRVEEEAPRSLA